MAGQTCNLLWMAGQNHHITKAGLEHHGSGLKSKPVHNNYLTQSVAVIEHGINWCAAQCSSLDLTVSLFLTQTM